MTGPASQKITGGRLNNFTVRGFKRPLKVLQRDKCLSLPKNPFKNTKVKESDLFFISSIAYHNKRLLRYSFGKLMKHYQPDIVVFVGR